MDDQTRIELEAAAFRRLRDHLRERTDVQNIDLMNLSGFCLSRWYQEAANERGVEMSKDEGRSIVYGMPYQEWREKYQTEATEEQRAAFEKSHSNH